MAEPMTYLTTPTKMVLRTLLNATEPMWTDQIALESSVPWSTANGSLRRMARAEWVETFAEPKESSAHHPGPPRRYWQLTDEGRKQAIERLRTIRTNSSSRDRTDPITKRLVRGSRMELD